MKPNIAITSQMISHISPKNLEIHILTYYDIQKNILQFLYATNYASWHILKKNIYSLLEESTVLGTSPEYQILYPLLRTGFIETACRPESGKLVYCIGNNVLIQINNGQFLKITPQSFSRELIDSDNVENYPILHKNTSLALLKRIPSLTEIIYHW